MQSSAQKRSLSGAVLGVLLAAAALLTNACAEGDTCKELGTCGGNPVGAWTYAAPPCQSLLDEPPTEVWLFNRPATVARTPPPESSASEWCADFVLSANAGEMAVAKPPVFWLGGSPYLTGRVWYKEDGTYESRVARSGRYGLQFSPACMRQYGSELSCDDIETLIVMKAGNPSLTGIDCQNGADPGSCDCSFDISSSGHVFGDYSVNGNTITHRPLRPRVEFPTDAVYCSAGDSLQLTGARSVSLFDRPGLRNMSMQRINCADGAQGPGEDGVDCGLMCPMLCEGQVDPEPLP